MACYKPFGAEDAGGWVDGAGEGVDAQDMLGFVVPLGVFSPVVGGDFFPGVFELVFGGEELHGEGVPCGRAAARRARWRSRTRQNLGGSSLARLFTWEARRSAWRVSCVVSLFGALGGGPSLSRARREKSVSE